MAGYRGGTAPAILSCFTGRGVWENRADRRGIERTGRGVGFGRRKRRAFLRGGAVSTARRANATEGKSKGKGQKSKGKKRGWGLGARDWVLLPPSLKSQAPSLRRAAA